jgi:hypothetical protein
MHSVEYRVYHDGFHMILNIITLWICYVRILDWQSDLLTLLLVTTNNYENFSALHIQELFITTTHIYSS